MIEQVLIPGKDNLSKYKNAVYVYEKSIKCNYTLNTGVFVPYLVLTSLFVLHQFTTRNFKRLYKKKVD